MLNEIRKESKFSKKNFYLSFEINSPCSIPRSDQNKSSIKMCLKHFKNKKKVFIFTKIRDDGEDLIKSDFMAWHTQDRQRVAERKIIIIITIMLITTNASSSPKTFLSNHIPFFNFSWKKIRRQNFFILKTLLLCSQLPTILFFWFCVCLLPSYFSFFIHCQQSIHTKTLKLLSEQKKYVVFSKSAS